MSQVTVFILPIAIGAVIIFALIKKIKVFDIFLSGAKDGIKCIVSIIPSLIGLVTAVSMLRASSALELLSQTLMPITNFLHIPNDIVPLLFLKPISGSGSLSFVDSILHSHGPDSFIGRAASTIIASTETTFYTLTIYFGAIKIQNTRHTIPIALLTNICGIILSFITVYFLL